MEQNATSSHIEPFHFQTLQQKRLYLNLRLLGPGPATFYREACSLMASSQQLKSTTHLVAHLLREIESAVRRVLLPYNFAFPEPCKTCDNRPEVHIKQIEAIAKSLELDKRLQDRWKEIATRNKAFNGLAEMAHREDLSLPRGVDASFKAVMSAFEDVFDNVLIGFERQSTHVFALLDSLVLKERPSKTKKDLSTLKNKVPHNDATHRYFFERLQSSGWLEPLHQDGFFTPPPTREWDEELGRPIFPAWPPAPYLLRMAAIESAQPIVIAILHDVADTSNPFVQHTVLQVAQKLPAPLAATLLPALQKWVQDSYIQASEFIPISDLISHLAYGGESESSIKLLETFFTTLGRKDSFTEWWDFEKMLTTSIPLLIKDSAVKALSMLCRCLEEEIYEHYMRYRDVQEAHLERLKKEAQEASTCSWRRTIRETKGRFPATIHDPLNLLVSAFCQAAERATSEQLLTVDTIVSLIEEHPGRIFRRLVLYILSRFPKDRLDIVKRYLMDQTLFKDADVRHEYALLAQTAFSTLSNIEQKQWLDWVEAGPDTQYYQERHEKYYHVQPDDELVQQYLRVWQRNWLGEIREELKGAWKERYDALVAELGPTEPEDDFPVITWGHSTTGRLIEDLRSMSVDQIVYYLQEWRPPGDFMSPSYEDLGRMLTAIISEKPERFAENIRRFQDTNPIYVSAVIQGFTEAIRNHHFFDWESLLDLCQWVISQRYTFVEGDSTIIYDPAWAWTCQLLANLLLNATQAQPPVLSISYGSKIWDILKPLIDDPDPVQENVVDEEDQETALEYVTRAINSIRGVALHAVVSYALWQKRSAQEENKENGQDFNAISEVQAVLERHLNPDIDASLAVRSIYGQHLTDLVALDPQWTTKHLIYIFPNKAHQQMLRIVTWNTYILFCEPYNNVLALLHKEYAAAIERLDITKPSRSITENPDYQLGEHLIRFYWSGLITLSPPESLLMSFFMKASDILRGQVLAFIGRAFYHTGNEIPSEIIERAQLLWEWRLSEVQKATSITEYIHELAAFGWWFRADICPPEWGLYQLEAVLILAGYVDLSYAIVERLAKLVESYPTQAVKCLEFLVKGNTMMWTTSTWEKAVRPILTYGLQEATNDTRRQAKAIISSLALHGMTDFLNLLSEVE